MRTNPPHEGRQSDPRPSRSPNPSPTKPSNNQQTTNNRSLPPPPLSSKKNQTQPTRKEEGDDEEETRGEGKLRTGDVDDDGVGRRTSGRLRRSRSSTELLLPSTRLFSIYFSSLGRKNLQNRINLTRFTINPKAQFTNL